MPFYFPFISYLADILVETYVANPKGNKPRRDSVNRELELSSPQIERYKPARRKVTQWGAKIRFMGRKRLHEIHKYFRKIKWTTY